MNVHLGLRVASALFLMLSVAAAENAEVRIPDTQIRIFTWSETGQGVDATPHYAVAMDGVNRSRARETSYEVQLRHDRFDPLAAGGAPEFSDSPLAAGAGGNIAIVQFICPPLEEMRQAIRALGGTVYNFFTNHCHLVQMSPETRAAVAALPYVRWVGDYHPSYRTEQFLLDRLTDGNWADPMRLYVQVFERGLAQKQVVAARILALGGAIVEMIPDGFRLEAMLSAAQFRQVLSWDEVLFVDRWSAPESDMNIAREISGSNYLESITGWTGQGVRGEVYDGNVRDSHQDFQSNPILLHGPRGGDRSHGTPVTGIVFGDGTANPQGRGLLPSGQPIFADYEQGGNRYTHTAELLGAPYFAVFQTNSWGGGLTRDYTSTSMEMDDIIFLEDFVILNSQSNAGSQDSRPQAWAKNILSVGGIKHEDTLSTADDNWTNGGSIGPAADGRIKPDLAHFYDSTLAPSGDASGTDYTQFGGTSGATPITAGHIGLLHQMWHEGIFGNPNPGASVFANRPHCTLAKAMLINTATQWDFSGAGHDLTRVHQGWGRADVRNLYDLRDKIFYVDESSVLTPMSSAQFQVYVSPGEPAFKATLVYLDVPGTTSAGQHRINDLSLQVTDPMGTVYWGNNGLNTSHWSSAGGSSNTIDTVENVMLQSPASGLWTVRVFADEINQDGHTETPAIDADFALVISGIEDAQAGCSATAPASPLSGDAAIDFSTFSAAAPNIDVAFDFTTDAGASWQPCTAAAGSAVPNPATAIPVGAATFTWNTAADGAGVGGQHTAQVRLTVDDGIAVTVAPCSTAAFQVIPEPPTCNLVGPAGVATMDVSISLDSASVNSPTVTVQFEYSLNGGGSWQACTPAVTSPLSNPAAGTPTGMATFIWNTRADSVGRAAVALAVLVRAGVDDLVSPLAGECQTAAFDVDNVPPSPFCTITPPAGSSFRNVLLPINVSSPNAPTVDLVLDYSLDGISWTRCTAAVGSALPNPASGVALGATSFLWATVPDLVALATLETGVRVRITLTDGVAPVAGVCDTGDFTVDNRPPTCSLTPPGPSAYGGINIQLDSASSHSATVVCSFEYSTDGGSSFRLCTTAAGSQIQNPGGVAPVGTRNFRWDSRADGVALTAALPGVLVRANVIDGIAPTSGNCITIPFEVDNTVRCGGICGDCNLSSTGPDVLDSLTAAQLAAGIFPAMGDQPFCCDVDSNQRVDVIDSLRIAQSAAGIAVVLVCP